MNVHFGVTKCYLNFFASWKTKATETGKKQKYRGDRSAKGKGQYNKIFDML